MFQEANQFELSGKGYRVSYSTTSIAGVPLLHLVDRGSIYDFRGEQIRVEESALGQIVSVTVRSVPDLETEIFSLVLPSVHIREGEQEVSLEVPGIYSTHRTSIGGPAMVAGPLASYRCVHLNGVARWIVA